MKKRVVTVLALLVVAVAVHGQPKTDPVLDKLATEFAAAMNAKNATLVASFYAADAVLMPADEQMVSGRSNIEAYYKRNFEEDTSNLVVTPLESAISGDQAFEAGTSALTHGTGAALLGGRPAITERGKYLVVYKRIGNAWKIAYDIFNSN
jgi:uncharacterized protein (TIGR02246 family)